MSPVDSSCGIFVSSSHGDDGNDGSQGKPFQSLQHAIASASGKPIYACGELFIESVTVGANLTIYGALDCSKGWAYDATKKTEITTAVDEIPLTLTASAVGAAMFDFAITAVDAKAPGGSSIAVIANAATAALTRFDLVAGAGVDGAAGTPQNQVAAGVDGKPGVASLPLCMNTNSQLGGAGGALMCGGMDVGGGHGGQGNPTATGDPGQDGASQPQPNAMAPFDGKGGQGGAPCLPGHNGSNGTNGTSGTGATGIGDLNLAGYTPSAATDGKTPGTPGYGGGGGGGAKQCAATSYSGPPGGGGGSGGCGGAVGNAGGSAGSSIGLVSVGAMLTLTNVTITTAAGSKGGTGGDGQAGGDGGQPGASGGAGACVGGGGGLGGRGGSGAGGLGGHSLGIAFKGTAPVQTTVTITIGAPGAGGIGGDMDMTAGVVGESGKACKTLSFDDTTCT